jgi:hypothetical protein
MLSMLVVFSLSLIQMDSGRVKVLEDRYQAKDRVAASYRPSRDEIRDSKKLLGLSDNKIAKQEYEALLQKYPDSPEVLVDYILFLDRSRMTALALETAQAAANRFPEQVRLLIIRDSMNAIARAGNRNAKSSHRQEMDALLATWNQMIVQHRSRSTKKSTSLGRSEKQGLQ